MNRRVTGLAARAGEVESRSGDWRLARMASLVDENRLGEEWDAERLLLVPRRDGLLVRKDPCQVAGCPNQLSVSRVALCCTHAEQFVRSDQPSVQAWLQSADIKVVHARLSDSPCVVRGVNGEVCGRPAVGSQRLCRSHLSMWLSPRIRGHGVTFEEYLTAVRPLENPGECLASCCYLKVAYPQIGLCEVHYRYWKDRGRPQAAAFGAFLAQAPQPANRRILSLRGLPVLVRLELLHGICCRMDDQVRTGTDDMRGYVDMLRAAGVASVTDIAPQQLGLSVNAGPARFARYLFDRVQLAYADPDTERDKDVWDLRAFGRSGRLDFSVIGQSWLRQAAKEWASASVRGRSRSTLQHYIHALGVMSEALSGCRNDGHDPRTLDRRDIDRFLTAVGAITSSRTGKPCEPGYVHSIVKHCALFIREARDMGFLPTLSPTFAFRRADGAAARPDRDGRALPGHVVAQLDAHLDLLRAPPGNLSGGPRRSGRGVLGERAGETAVLAYQLLKGTGRRAGEVASLRLDCLDRDEHDRPVLIYDNHKARRMARRLPLADTALVEAIQAQQTWVANRFPHTPRANLWLLPRPTKNADGTGHIDPNLIGAWMRAWVDRIPRIDTGGFDQQGQPVLFERDAIHPHAFRHTYAQTLADQGVPAPVLRDLMDHRSIDTSLGYYKVGDTRKREAMERLAAHTLNNRGVSRAGGTGPSSIANLREQLSWVAVPMGKCSEPTNVKAGGGACPIRYQCAGCPHFESDPSYLPELRAYADQLRREREAMIAVNAADWVVNNVTGQLEVIASHIRHHEDLLKSLPADERTLIEHASATVRKARQAIPVAFGRREQTLT